MRRLRLRNAWLVDTVEHESPAMVLEQGTHWVNFDNVTWILGFNCHQERFEPFKAVYIFAEPKEVGLFNCTALAREILTVPDAFQHRCESNSLMSSSHQYHDVFVKKTPEGVTERAINPDRRE